MQLAKFLKIYRAAVAVVYLGLASAGLAIGLPSDQGPARKALRQLMALPRLDSGQWRAGAEIERGYLQLSHVPIDDLAVAVRWYLAGGRRASPERSLRAAFTVYALTRYLYQVPETSGPRDIAMIGGLYPQGWQGRACDWPWLFSAGKSPAYFGWPVSKHLPGIFISWADDPRAHALAEFLDASRNSARRGSRLDGDNGEAR